MANLVYIAPEAAVTFGDTGLDVDITLQNLAAGAGRISVRHDGGAADRAETFEWRCTIQMETAGVVGETVDLYLSTSDGTRPDGEEGVVDAALGSTDSLKNMLYIGSVVIDTVSTATNITASGIITIVARYLSLVVHNNTADNLENTQSTSSFSLTPVPLEIQ